uniref:Ig-like domain-containing protein n=1 Tax=Cyprinus carpio TaxID=7962 RepID=A0A8C2ENF1_CYPCA
GADVIINCDLDIEEIYWYKQKSPDPPEFILRTFDSTYEGAQYENSNFTHKYSVKTNSRLFIRNITADELGVYYCVKTSEPLKFSNGTKIYITDSVHENQTESQQETPWRNLTIITSVLNVLLIVALIGLGTSYLQARRFKNSSENPQSTTTAHYSNDSQHAAVDLSMHPSENTPCQEQAIYYLLQPVKICCGGPSHMSKLSVQPQVNSTVCTSTAAEIKNTSPEY